MNAYQKKRNTAAVLALSAMLLAAPACSQAMDTAPLVPGRQAEQTTGERLITFGKNRAFRGVTTSGKWLRQARLNGMMLNLRVFTPMGEEVVFKEKLSSAETGGADIRLNIFANTDASSIMLQLDQKAVDLLKNLNVTEIVVGDRNSCVRISYLVSELDAVRGALALEAEEQLCVSGEEDPITVVSEDGVRRQVTQ